MGDPLSRRAAAILLCVASAVVSAQLPHIPVRSVAGDPLREAENLIYRDAGSDARIEQLLSAAADVADREPDGAARAYWQARVHLAAAIYHNREGASRDAVRAVDRGLAFIEDALAAGPFSDGLRVRADLRAQMIDARGIAYMIRNGAAARDDALQARELDPTNVKALITVAGFLLNAPPFAGGSVPEAIATLEAALRMEPDSENDRFLIHAWLAQAHHRNGSAAVAQRELRAAEAIHPASVLLDRVREELQG